MRTTPEGAIVKACLDYLAMLDIPAWRNNTGAARLKNPSGKSYFVKFSVKGASDIFAILPPKGRFLAIECKAGTNRPTPEQAAFLDRVRRTGGVGLVVRDVNELVEFFARRHIETC